MLPRVLIVIAICVAARSANAASEQCDLAQFSEMLWATSIKEAVGKISSARTEDERQSGIKLMGTATAYFLQYGAAAQKICGKDWHRKFWE